MHIAIFKHGKP